MDDYSFANIVRSNKPHSVSVSERTGNATTTKNIVSSDADDHQSKKAAFEKKQQEEKVNVSKSNDKEDNIQIVNIDIESLKTKNQDVSVRNKIETNTQSVNNSFVNLNSITENDAIRKNLQKLDTDNIGNNSPNISATARPSNKQPFNEDNSNPNIQKIPTKSRINSNQPVFDTTTSVSEVATQNLSSKDNNLGLGDTSFVNNRQSITDKDSSLNIQGAPEEESLEINRQPIDSGNFKDHLEILSSDKVVRNKVDFGSANKNISSSVHQTSSRTLAKEQSIISNSINASPTQSQLTAQQTAKLKRDKSNEDFQGRVAAIRRNVKALNSMLDSFEPHV